MKSQPTLGICAREVRFALLAAASCGSLFMLSSANAQTVAAKPATPAIDEIVITGTSIRGVAAVGAPTISLDREAMLASGASNSSELARSLPQVINLGADDTRLGGAQDGAANTTRTQVSTCVASAMRPRCCCSMVADSQPMA